MQPGQADAVATVDQVSGRARYAADLKVPGMLHAKVLRSPHHHARIVRIETAEAAALPEFERAIKLDEGVLRFLVVVNEGAQPVPVTAGKSDEEEDE